MRGSMGTEEADLDSLENFTFKNQYVDEDGISYIGDSHDLDGAVCELAAPANFLQGRILGFCLCGDPLSMLIEVCGYLEKIEKEKWLNFDFMAYYLDSVGLTEHGGSINSAWLSEKGKRFIRIVRELESRGLKK